MHCNNGLNNKLVASLVENKVAEETGDLKYLQDSMYDFVSTLKEIILGEYAPEFFNKYVDEALKLHGSNLDEFLKIPKMGLELRQALNSIDEAIDTSNQDFRDNLVLLLDRFQTTLDNIEYEARDPYDTAVELGFQGTKQDWLKHLEGDSAYAIAVNNGYEGTQSDWLKYIRADGFIQSIQQFATNDAETKVQIPDYGTINSLQGYIKDMFEKGGLPATPFATKALMTDSALVDGQYSMVTNDSDNNGLYTKIGDAWVKSEYSPVLHSEVSNDLKGNRNTIVSRKALVDALTNNILVAKSFEFNLSGFYFASNGTFSDSIALVATEKIAVRKGAKVYYGVKSSSSAAGRVAFLTAYSNTNTFLYAVAKPEEPLVTEFVEGVYEVEEDGYVAVSSFVKASILETPYLIMEIEKDINGDITSNAKNLRGLSKMISQDGISEIAFDVVGFYRGTTGEFVTRNDIFRSTELTPVKKGDVINITTRSGSGAATRVSLFDINKTLVSSLVDHRSNPYSVTDELLTIPQDGFIGCSSFIGAYEGIPSPSPELLLLRSPIFSLKSDSTNNNNSIGGTCVISPTSTILLAGASFATSSKAGWFELMCNSLGVTAVNKSVGGRGITNMAAALNKGYFYTQDLLNNADALLIMHAWNYNIMAEKNITINGTEYTDSQLNSWTAEDYEATSWDRLTTPIKRGLTDEIMSALWDYTLKKLQAIFYAEKDNELSKWYGTTHGKPFNVILTTHWHDARVAYNNSVRILCGKWGLSLIEFDKNIGFSKDSLLPNGLQHSRIYERDGNNSELINGVRYAHHFQGGQDEPMVRRMAGIAKASFEVI